MIYGRGADALKTLGVSQRRFWQFAKSTQRPEIRKSFDDNLAEFLGRYRRVSLTERINALKEQTMWLEIDRDARTQGAQERAYGEQLLMPRPR